MTVTFSRQMFYFMCVSFLFFSDVGSVLWTFGATVNIGYFWPRLVRQSMGTVDNSLTKFSGGEPAVMKLKILYPLFCDFLWELSCQGPSQKQQIIQQFFYKNWKSQKLIDIIIITLLNDVKPTVDRNPLLQS